MNKKLIIGSFIFIAIIAGIIIYFSFLKYDKKAFSEKFKTEEAIETFKIYIPSSTSLLTKEIYLQKDELELKNLEKILEIFLVELLSPLKETKILGIYRDKENIIYIDLSKNFAAPQSMREEYFVIKSLYKTLKENFTWIKDVKILIESKEVETLSGHISIESSLKEVIEES